MTSCFLHQFQNGGCRLAGCASRCFRDQPLATEKVASELVASVKFRSKAVLRASKRLPTFLAATDIWPLDSDGSPQSVAVISKVSRPPR